VSDCGLTLCTCLSNESETLREVDAVEDAETTRAAGRTTGLTFAGFDSVGLGFEAEAAVRSYFHVST
jgi:hypothetical protein